MSLHDACEAVIRQWHKYEVDRNGSVIIDYDCKPRSGEEADPIASRLDVHRRLSELKSAACAEQDLNLVERLTADLTYLEALLGAQRSLEDYLLCTQGCAARGWSPDYVVSRGALARELLKDRDVSWGAQTLNELEHLEGALSPVDAPSAIRAAAWELQPRLRDYSGVRAEPDIAIETVEVDDYWAYWLDGASQKVRLRLNLKNAKFTTVRARQFALHELLGHAIQYANLSLIANESHVEWFPLFSVHATNQVLFEGLAQALPLFMISEDSDLAIRVRLDHYIQLVRAELHIALNEGSSIASCVEHAHQRVPWWTNEDIAGILSDRGINSPLLRTYLWAYPAGCDWFVNLADQASPTFAQEVISAAYLAPLSPKQLEAKWPAGPPIGGGGRSVRLR